MELTAKQQQGLEIALDRFRKGQKYTVISGYAGSGKSTLVKFIIAALAEYGIDPDEDVVFTSFTGKATQVLQKKGNKNTCTLHRLLYEFKPIGGGKFIKMPREELEYSIVVVDEVSMAPQELIRDLFKHHVYIICLGDPEQLPPVNPREDNHLLDEPHIFLDEIMRQAAESEIIQLSMQIRTGNPCPYRVGNEIQVLRRFEFIPGMLQWADQVICATNRERVLLNNEMRQMQGRGADPEDGDKIICTRNYWDVVSDKGTALINGTIGYLRNSYESFLQTPYGRIPTVNGEFVTDTGEVFEDISIDKGMLEKGEPTLGKDTMWKLSGQKKYRNCLPYDFLYGYAITGHKSQGSEWDKILVIEEAFPKIGSEEHRRWLYTCVTRAAEKLVLVRV